MLHLSVGIAPIFFILRCQKIPLPAFFQETVLLEKTEFFIFLKNVYIHRIGGTKKNGGQADQVHGYHISYCTLRTTKNDKGKPVEKQGRKATGLRQRRRARLLLR